MFSKQKRSVLEDIGRPLRSQKQKSGGQMTQHEGAIDDLFGVVFRPIWTRHGAIAFARVGNAPDGATRIIGN